MRAALHLANKYHMVAFFITAAVEALKGGRCADQQRGAANAVDERGIGKTVKFTCGKTSGQRLLIGAQDIDGVMRAGPEGLH